MRTCTYQWLYYWRFSFCFGAVCELQLASYRALSMDHMVTFKCINLSILQIILKNYDSLWSTMQIKRGGTGCVVTVVYVWMLQEAGVTM